MYRHSEYAVATKQMFWISGGEEVFSNPLAPPGEALIDDRLVEMTFACNCNNFLTLSSNMIITYYSCKQMYHVFHKLIDVTF